MSAADPKRVFLSSADSSEFLKKPDKASSSKSKTLRLSINLFEPDEYKFPEFNFRKLMHIEKKKQKKLAKLPNGNHADPFGDNDDDVERITRELEAKYGTGSAYSKSAKLTTVDRGAGYDASDSFIDDTEAYDELIPDEIETDRGGFYINSGALEFKKLSNYERPGDEIRMPKAKKRALSTSSESSGSEAGAGKTEVKQKKKNHAEKKPKTATSSSDEQGKAAKKLKKDKPEKPKELQPVKEVKKPVEKEPEKVVKTTTVKDMLRAKRDKLQKLEQGRPGGSGTTTTNTDNEDGESESGPSSLAVSESSRDSHPETPAPAPAPILPVNGAVKESTLPEELSDDVTSVIKNLKKIAETAISTKTPFFTNDIKDQLVKVDNNLKVLGPSVRVQCFTYIADFAQCSKKTLFEKVRKHRVDQVAMKFRTEVNKLRKIVGDAMPGSIVKYEHEMKQYETKKNLQSFMDDSTELRVPSKKFHWNDASRQELYDLNLKLFDLFRIVKPKKASQEEFLEQKLREEVMPIWPEGWIKFEDFKKELEKKQKKEAKAAAAASAQGSTKSPTSATVINIVTTNGKASLKTEPTTSKSPQPPPSPVTNGRLETTTPPQATSVIKRSSDHSISSIISSTPSPPTTSKALEIEKIPPSDPLPKPSLPKFHKEPTAMIDITSPEKVSSRRSNSSDSDCVEIVGEYTNHLNNNVIKTTKVNSHSISPHPQPVAKKSKKHGSDDGEQGTDYSKIIMGLQSLTDPKKTNQFLAKNPLSSPIPQHQNQRKAETSHD